MKGVTCLRVTYLPVANCRDDACGWTLRPSRWDLNPGRNIRAAAQGHVKKTGHDVDVEVMDRTTYAPEAGEAAS